MAKNEEGRRGRSVKSQETEKTSSSREKKSFIPGKPASKPGFRKSEKSDEPTFKKSFGEKKNYGKAEGDRRKSDKPFGEKRSFGSKSGPERSFGDKRKEGFGEKRSFGKPFGEKRNSDRPFGERKESDRPYGERRGPVKSFGDKKSFDKPFGEKRSFGRGNDDRRGNDRPYGDKRDEKRSFGERRSESRPYGDRRSSERPARDNRSFDKPAGGRFARGEGDSGKGAFGGERDDRGKFFRNDERGNEQREPGRFPRSNKPFGRNAEDREEKPGFRKFSKSSERPDNNERQVGMKRPPRYDKEHLEKKAPYKAKDKIAKEVRKEDNEEIRLNRYIANAGLCSRREADELIASGMIRVNGKVVTEMGYKVKDSDTVKYGKDVLSRERMMYILLNKPKDYITTMDDPDERRTVMDLIEGACKERVYPVGRLDRNTTGLLLLTNDGELTEKLTHPSQEVKKIYQAELNKPFAEEHFEALKEGIELEDGFIKPDQLAYVTPDAEVVGIEIHSGKNRIVRRIFEHFGYEVTKLDRTTFAGLTKKELPRGKWRFLSEKEVIMLKYLL